MQDVPRKGARGARHAGPQAFRLFQVLQALVLLFLVVLVVLEALLLRHLGRDLGEMSGNVLLRLAGLFPGLGRFRQLLRVGIE